MKIEVLQAKGCPRCLRELDGLRAAARYTDPAVEWQELEILAVLDYAVELGVLKAPAIVIDGQLVFSALPAPDALARAMRMRLEGAR